MTYSPQQILNFLSKHYPALQQLYRWAKDQNHLISEVQLTSLTQEQQIAKQLLHYKILQPHPQGGYLYQDHYYRFFAFLHNDFSLDLPERLEKYRNAFRRLKGRLTSTPADAVEQVTTICDNFMDELHQFLAHLADNTLALENAVDKLRVKLEKGQDPTTRIAQATYLIDTYLKPLNHILAPHADAIATLLDEVRDYAYAQYLELPDAYRHTPYKKLHTHLALASNQLIHHLNRLVRNLLPLLEQIRRSNQILAGFKILRDAHAERDYARYLPLLPPLIKRSQHHVYNAYREGDAEAIISSLGEAQPVVLRAQAPPVQPWVFRTTEYREVLYQALPLDNFFVWAYETLQKNHPEEPIVAYQLLQVANLLFDDKVQATFTQQRSALHLHNATFHVPHVQVQQLA